MIVDYAVQTGVRSIHMTVHVVLMVGLCCSAGSGVLDACSFACIEDDHTCVGM